MIYLIKGKNGAGKTFLANHLYELGYERSISCTTRKPREKEVNGIDYYFISKEEFEEKIKSNFFAEYQEANGHYYGTPKQKLKDGVILVSSDKNDIEHNYNGNITTFYIDAPLELRYRRMIERGATETEIFSRFTKENADFLYDFNACFIDNGVEEQSLSQILRNIMNPKIDSNRNFIYKRIKSYEPIRTDDELVTFLQFEEFLLRGIFLDNKIKSDSVDRIYFNYMKKFLTHKHIQFEKTTKGEYSVKLNGKLYSYNINTDKIIKEGEKKTYEREID